MTGRVSDIEQERWLGTRLENYRLAVLAGFYNEGPATVAYKGFQFVPDNKAYAIMQNGRALIHITSLHTAKIWVTCRVSGVNIVEANAIIREENAS